MSLTDIMSSMHLNSFAEVALGLFFIAFMAIAIHVFRTRDDDVWERARHLPLDATRDATRDAAPRPLPSTQPPLRRKHAP